MKNIVLVALAVLVAGCAWMKQVDDWHRNLSPSDREALAAVAEVFADAMSP